MTLFLQEFTVIFIFISCSFILAFILLGAVYLIGFNTKIDLETSSAYECGFVSFSETSFPFEVQFAVIAIMFLLFDIEVLYLFPLIQALYSISTLDAWILFAFYFLLLVGLLYEINRKVPNFQTAQDPIV